MENQSNPHHLVLGKLNDFLTGTILPDTLDERYRQKIAKSLVIDCKFEKKNIQKNMSLEVIAGLKKAVIKIDFLVVFQKNHCVDKICPRISCHQKTFDLGIVKDN